MKLLEKLRDASDWLWTNHDTITLFRWQHKGNYVIVYHDGPHLLTWHAPWCPCELAGQAYEFHWLPNEGALYASGLGFELTWVFEDAGTIAHVEAKAL